MKPNKIMEKICFHTLAVFAISLLVIDNMDAIRVYERTNFPDPKPKSTKTLGFSKKSLYISKRSWSPGEEKTTKSDVEGKWKNINKRTGLEGAPVLYKIKFSDKTFMQYLRYIKEVPRLEEYTFCLWYKPENLSHDQTLFTYSLNKNEVLLRFWIHAIDSTFRMAIRENLVYKVPAIIRENKWYHICQSWNGVLGEWQVFLDGKRIGAGVLSRYSGTYIPEGGDVTLGQEMIGLNKRLTDGIDGEIFGFNLVDEAVPQDQGVFINSQYRPNVQGNVPPFKKLPPIKKTYQEIKAYISSLPNDTSEHKKNEGEISIKKPKDKVLPKRNRGNPRLRYPPLRKIVVYNRDDRQLPLDDALIELNKTNTAQNQTTEKTFEVKKETQPLDKNYSIHSYRSEKNERENNNYEIYESSEDDGAEIASEDKLANQQSLERKARENFNLFTARQANKVYTLSTAVKGLKKPKFHFEMRARAKEPEKNNQRNFISGEIRAGAVKSLEGEIKRTSLDVIPVYEVEINAERERKRRSADELKQSRQFTTGDANTDSNGFRRLPQIPDSFISIFTENASRSEMEEKLDQFFPKSNYSEKVNVVAKITEAPKTSSEFEDAPIMSLPSTNKIQLERFTTESPVPNFSPILPQIQSRENIPDGAPTLFTSLTNPGPVNFPVVQEFNSSPLAKEMNVPIGYDKPPQVAEPIMERRFAVSSGTDLVMRSYGECTTDRGSPVRDQEHLVISWADTPVQIFGGAQVEGARNQCGHF